LLDAGQARRIAAGRGSSPKDSRNAGAKLAAGPVAASRGMICHPAIFSFALDKREDERGRVEWLVMSSCGPIVLRSNTLLDYARFRRAVRRRLGVRLAPGLPRAAWWRIINDALAPLRARGAP
jgi:hypothetical protein